MGLSSVAKVSRNRVTRKLMESPSGRSMLRTTFLMLTKQFKQPGRPREWREQVRKNPELLEPILSEFINYFVRKGDYSSTIVPTILATTEASNLSPTLKKPRRDEIEQLLCLLLTGLPHGNLLVNLINVNEDTYFKFREELIERGALVLTEDRCSLDKGRLFEPLKGRRLPITEPSVFAFAFLNFMVYFDRLGRKEAGFHTDFDDFFRRWRLEEDSGIIVAKIPPRGEKGEVRIYSRLGSFLKTWYSDYERVEEPETGLFAASLYVAHKNYRDLSAKLLDKFLHYMLGGYVSGELLDKLVTLKANAFLDPKVGKRGFSRIKNFLGKMS